MRSRHCVPYEVAIWTGAICGCGHLVERHTLAKNCRDCSCSDGYIERYLDLSKPTRDQADDVVTVTVNATVLIEVQP